MQLSFGQMDSEFEEIEDREYQGFVDKFKPKKTTDDCYTPPDVYEAVRAWACERYGIDPGTIVRPFYPGGDYERYDYPEGCVVLDNPPFSILAKITRFYASRRIPYFLFAPTLTLFSPDFEGRNYVSCGFSITYENGARVNTSFITSMGEYKLETAPDLYEALKRVNGGESKKHRVIDFPPNVITPARIGVLSKRGCKLSIPAEQMRHVVALDEQRAEGKKIFGGGFLISDQAAEQKRTAEIAEDESRMEQALKSTVTETDGAWHLSERERAIVAELSQHLPVESR